VEGVWRRTNRGLGSGISVLGGAAVLEWAEVFGDGGPIIQLILGIVAFVIGTWIFVRNFNT
jgi:hypothetical protein